MYQRINKLKMNKYDTEMLMKYIKMTSKKTLLHSIYCSNNYLSRKVEHCTIVVSNCVKLTGIKIDNELKLDTSVGGLCKKACQYKIYKQR